MVLTKTVLTKKREKVSKAHSSPRVKRRRRTKSCCETISRAASLCETSSLKQEDENTNEDSCCNEQMLKPTCDQQPTVASHESSERGSAIVWDENNIFVGKRVAGYFDATQIDQSTNLNGKKRKSSNEKECGQLFIGTVVSYAPESSPGEYSTFFRVIWDDGNEQPIP